MPNNSLPGLRADFVAFLVPDGDRLFDHAKTVVDDLNDEDRRFSPRHVAKVQIHTWLAWQADPGTPLGLAITKQYLDAEAALARGFMTWLRRLFVD